MSTRLLVFVVAVAAVVLVGATAAFAATLANPGFEAGDLSGWNADSEGAGAWGVTSTGSGECTSGALAPASGTYAALWDMGGPSIGILSQSFTVPSSETLSFAFAYDNQAGEWLQNDDPYAGDSNQWMRIDVIESSADITSLDPSDIVATAFDSQSGSPAFSQGWTNASLSLPGRAGDTLRFRVLTANTENCFPVWVDDGVAPQNGGRAGYCSVAGNTTTSGAAIPPGTFLDLGVDQPATDPHFKGATPAYYYQGRGISCDVLPGYTKTGEMVGYGGHGDPGGYTYMAKN